MSERVRRGLLAALLGVGLTIALTAVAAPGPTAAPSAASFPTLPDDMALGSPRAPVTVVEYASLGCPHCAVWAREVFPSFKKTYVDSGKVRFVLREMLFGNSTLAAAGFLTARCAGAERYFQVVDGIFDDQAKIEQNGADEMLSVAKTAGLTEDRFKACLRDPAALQALEARANRYVTVDKITGTPTFVINGKVMEGEQSLASLDAAIAAAARR